MQLVLDVQGSLGLASASAPLPAPPDGSRLSARALRRIGWAAIFVALAALGALQGATVAIGADGVSALATDAPAPSEPAGAQTERELRRFWRPEASTAARPAAEIAPRRWRPEQRP
jgi:hypothetical protein